MIRAEILDFLQIYSYNLVKGYYGLQLKKVISIISKGRSSIFRYNMDKWDANDAFDFQKFRIRTVSVIQGENIIFKTTEKRSEK